MSNLRILAVLCIGAVAAAAPAFAATQGPAAGKTVKVGVIVDVTGPAGVYGTYQKSAYDLATDDMKNGLMDTGGATLVFNLQDSATDPNQAANLMQAMSGDGSALVLGPTLSSEAKKVDPIGVAAKQTIVGTSTTAQGITAMGPCVFRVALAEEQVVPEVVAVTLDKWKYKTAAIIYGDDDQFTKTDYDLFKAALDKAGVKIVSVQTFHKQDVDFSSQLTAIKAANPDVIYMGAIAAEGSKIVAQIGKLGIKAHLVGGNGFNSPDIRAVAGTAADGLVIGAAWYVGSNLGDNKAFVDRYRKKYSRDPDQFAAQAYAAAQVVAQTVKGGAITPDATCAAFKTGSYTTVLGKLSFDANRDVNAPKIVVQITPTGYEPFK